VSNLSQGTCSRLAHEGRESRRPGCHAEIIHDDMRDNHRCGYACVPLDNERLSSAFLFRNNTRAPCIRATIIAQLQAKGTNCFERQISLMQRTLQLLFQINSRIQKPQTRLSTAVQTELFNTEIGSSVCRLSVASMVTM
jgi:hypothetical protein